MAGETILIIDAGQDLDERMTTALEAEGYLSYSVSSQDVNAQLADLLKPSLIYIRPPDLRPTGLDPCKNIHGIPLLMKVPVVMLAFFKKPPSPHYLEEYGIVDFLEPTFSTEELLKKTAAILGENSLSHFEKTLTFTQEKTSPSNSDMETTPHFAQPSVEEPQAPLPVRNLRKKPPAVVLAAVAAMVILGIAGTAYMVYQPFLPSQRATPIPAAKIPARVAISAPKTGMEPQLPPAGADVAKIPADGPQEKPAASTMIAPSAPLSPAVQPPTQSEKASQPLGGEGTAESDKTQQTSKTGSAKPFYSVQLGAFRDAGTAEAVMKQFQEKGYDAFTQPGVTKDRSRIYRVLVDRYEDRKAAQKMAGEIQTKEQVKTTLYSE